MTMSLIQITLLGKLTDNPESLALRYQAQTDVLCTLTEQVMGYKRLPLDNKSKRRYI